jgi:flagellar motor switch protein FliM
MMKRYGDLIYGSTMLPIQHVLDVFIPVCHISHYLHRQFNSKVERDNKQKDTLITAQSDAAETLQQLHTSRNNLHAELGKISTKLEEQV